MLVQKKPHAVATKKWRAGNEKDLKKKTDMTRIRRENYNWYKKNPCEIMHTDTTSPDVIARITTVTEREPSACLAEIMFIEDTIINKGVVVDVFPDIWPGNNGPSGTGWVKIV